MATERTELLSEFGMRVYLFLKEYVEFPEGMIITENLLRLAVISLLENKIFSAEKLREEALRKQRVIIPVSWGESIP